MLDDEGMSPSADPSAGPERDVLGSELSKSALNIFASHGNQLVRKMALLPDGRRVVTGGNEGVMQLWRLDTGDRVRSFEGHTDTVWALAALPDGRRVVSGSEDGTARVWDVETGAELCRFQGHLEDDPVYSGGKSIWSLDVLPDGSRALSGSFAGFVCLWNVDTGTELQRFKPGFSGWPASEVR